MFSTILYWLIKEYFITRSAFNYTKIFSNGGEQEKENSDEEEKDQNSSVKNKVERTIDFSEFRMFLFALRQYFLICQVFTLLKRNMIVFGFYFYESVTHCFKKYCILINTNE